MVNVVLALDYNCLLGVDNKLPFNSKKDLKIFKEITTQNVFNDYVIMGRKTAYSLPKQKPLPDRFNIYMSRKGEDKFLEEQGFSYRTIDNIKYLFDLSGSANINIIGGKEIYELFFNKYIEYIDNIYLTVHRKEIIISENDKEKAIYYYGPKDLFRKLISSIKPKLKDNTSNWRIFNEYVQHYRDLYLYNEDTILNREDILLKFNTSCVYYDDELFVLKIKITKEEML